MRRETWCETEGGWRNLTKERKPTDDEGRRDHRSRCGRKMFKASKRNATRSPTTMEQLTHNPPSKRNPTQRKADAAEREICPRQPGLGATRPKRYRVQIPAACKARPAGWMRGKDCKFRIGHKKQRALQKDSEHHCFFCEERNSCKGNKR